jgi:hypothetical protein
LLTNFTKTFVTRGSVGCTITPNMVYRFYAPLMAAWGVREDLDRVRDPPEVSHTKPISSALRTVAWIELDALRGRPYTCRGACSDPRYVRASYPRKSSRPPCVVCLYVESHFGPPPASYARRQTGLYVEVRVASHPRTAQALQNRPRTRANGQTRHPSFFPIRENQFPISAENQTKPSCQDLLQGLLLF